SLEKSRDNRFATAADFAAALEGIRNSVAPDAKYGLGERMVTLSNQRTVTDMPRPKTGQAATMGSAPTAMTTAGAGKTQADQATVIERGGTLSSQPTVLERAKTGSNEPTVLEKYASQAAPTAVESKWAGAAEPTVLERKIGGKRNVAMMSG